MPGGEYKCDDTLFLKPFIGSSSVTILHESSFTAVSSSNLAGHAFGNTFLQALSIFGVPPTELEIREVLFSQSDSRNRNARK